MMQLIARIYRRVLDLLYLPLFLSRFLSREVGWEYNVSLVDKIRLLARILRNVRKIPAETSWREHVLMAENILSIPASIAGVVVECGCFKGASTASLSLVCSLTGRKLVVFDSFRGLPNPSDTDRVHHVPHLGEMHTYREGAFRGELEEVKSNLAAYGCAQVCELVPGFFEETLPEFSRECAFVFLDVDLRQSLETCLTYLWPLLQDGCRLFTHEAHHLEVAQVFFDKEWWRNLGSPPPGLIGAVHSVYFSAGFKSALGYTTKGLDSLDWYTKLQGNDATDTALCRNGT